MPDRLDASECSRTGSQEGWLRRWKTGAATLTREHLEKYSWSMDQCEKMAQEAREGESALTEKKEVRIRLLTLLGLEPKPGLTDIGATAEIRGMTATNQGSRRAKGRVGERSPVRDAIGSRC